jgi:hypothetical protein
MDAMDLTVDQEAEAQRIADRVMALARVEAIQIGRLLATRKDADLFGQTEFTVRDAVLRIGVGGLECALEERKKKATKEL